MSLSKGTVALVVIVCVLVVTALVVVAVLMLTPRKCQSSQSAGLRLQLEHAGVPARKVGVVMTTFGTNYIFAKQAALCFLRHVKQPLYMVLYVNGSEDERLLQISDELPEVTVIVLNKPAKGGLTWTWNDGIVRCIKEGCDIIILSNDDIIFDASIIHLIVACEKATDSKVYFGPITNAPGNEKNYAQQGTQPSKDAPYRCTYQGKPQNLNGFFLAFPVKSLVANMFDATHFFDPKYPYGGNETEWFARFGAQEGYGMVVPKTFVYHYKLKSWRSPQQTRVCVYTINLGGYEGERILLDNRAGEYNPADVLYFTDTDKMIYKCLKFNVQPFLIDVSRSAMPPKLLQRTIKAMPHLFLPAFYDTSVYVDGNVRLTDRVQPLVDSMNKHTLVCYQHPRVPCTVDLELMIIVKDKLAFQESVDTVMSEMFEYRFDPASYTLTETNMLIRKHHELVDFSTDWARMIGICPRDQASFDFLLWKHNIKYDRRPCKEKLIKKYSHVNDQNRRVSQW